MVLIRMENVRLKASAGSEIMNSHIDILLWFLENLCLLTGNIACAIVINK